jgi:hypothetical protein
MNPSTDARIVRTQEWLSPDMPSRQSDFSFSTALPLLLGLEQNCNWTANVNTTDTKEKHMDAATAGRVSVFLQQFDLDFERSHIVYSA